ncbi:hypothetical protein Hanom_Chr09g00817991 [Helianthus anomalus]
MCVSRDDERERECVADRLAWWSPTAYGGGATADLCNLVLCVCVRYGLFFSFCGFVLALNPICIYKIKHPDQPPVLVTE